MILRISYHLTPTPAASQAFRRRRAAFPTRRFNFFRHSLSYRHSGASRNLRPVIPSFRRKPESTRFRTVIPAQAGIYTLVIPSFRRKPESTRCDGLRVFAGATDPRLNHADKETLPFRPRGKAPAPQIPNPANSAKIRQIAPPFLLTNSRSGPYTSHRQVR